MKIENLINKVIQGNSLEVLKNIPNDSIDLIFADPPYNLQLSKNLFRPDQSKVNGVNEEWDIFNNFEDYDLFTFNWLRSCRDILKDDGSMWVIGSYHNIFRLGYILQNLGFWILNDVVWVKNNPMPKFRGKRFTNAHETLIWVTKNKNSKYTFNYESMKSLNGDLQMRSDWNLPICNGKERLKDNDGFKAHPTQKPESLLNRILMASSKVDDIVLDPFFGTGTTGTVAKKLNRNFIGIEQSKTYVNYAKARIKNTKRIESSNLIQMPSKEKVKRIPFGSLLEKGLILPGEILTDLRKRWTAKVRADGSLISNENKGSIHSVGAALQGLPACNGWTFWYIQRAGKLVPIDHLRNSIRLTFQTL